jgi:hypothetical protein
MRRRKQVAREGSAAAAAAALHARRGAGGRADLVERSDRPNRVGIARVKARTVQLHRLASGPCHEQRARAPSRNGRQRGSPGTRAQGGARRRLRSSGQRRHYGKGRCGTRHSGDARGSQRPPSLSEPHPHFFRSVSLYYTCLWIQLFFVCTSAKGS